ncbi:MAG: alternative ribosome rescue aminoacyl-tRNA hydrolase ArfB [Acidimicrobiia bacterium]
MHIPRDELQWTFTTSGGPGGQHANRSSTRVEVRFDVASSRALDEPTKRRIIAKLGKSEVRAAAAESRSQWRNRKIALRRLVDIIEQAAKPEPRRRPTRPPAGARERRLAAKKHRSRIKRLRRGPEDE